MTLLKKAFTMPCSMWRDLSYVSIRAGVSRSALLVELLEQPLADLRAMMEAVPADPTPDDIVRARGQSRAIVDDRLAALRRLEDETFGG
jgi:hypothetical protein